MFGLDLSQAAQATLALCVLAGMMVMFVRETYPVEVVALGGALIMLILGILPTQDVAAVLSNNAPWTIAAMFIIVGALVRTGVLDRVSQFAIQHATDHPKMTLVVMGLCVTAASAFVNNTPLVVVMMPIFIGLARQLQVAPSKMLIPLSYMTILGGTMTLVGTSTNLVVDGVAQSKGIEHFGIFEIAPIGIAVAAAGLLYLALFAKRMLPNRDSMSTLLTDRTGMKFFTEVAIPEGSAFVGKTLAEMDLFTRSGARVIDVLRGDHSLRRDLGSVVLEQGDRVVLRTAMAEVLGLRDEKELRQVDALATVQTTTVEVLITPGCKMIGRSLGQMRLRRRYGVYPLAVHRRDRNIGRQLDDVVIDIGDTLLLEGALEDIQRLATDMDLADVTHPTARAYRRGHAPIVISVMAGIILLASFNLAPIQYLAFVGVGIVLLTRAIDADEALGAVDGRLMALLFGMLGVGAGLENSGAISLLVTAMAPYMVGLSPFLLVFMIYAITSILTEIVSNNAVAVLITPIVISLAQNIGVDPRPLILVVMVGASASFATPIGYQTNTLVYGPGGYKFIDFIRFGVPLNLISALVVTLIVPVFYTL